MFKSTGSVVSRQSWLIFILLSIIWGSSFILIKKGLVALSYWQVGSLRILLSAVALLPFVFFTRKNINRTNIFPIIGVGIFGSGIPPFLFAIAQTQIDSALAGMLNTLNPLFTFIFGVFFFSAVFRLNKLIGVLIGLAGALLIIATDSASAKAGNNLYGIFIILGTMCYALSVNIIYRYLKNTSPLTITAWSFFIMSGFAFIIFLLSNPIATFRNEPLIISSFISVLILSVVCTAIANLMFFKMTQETNALFASTITYTIPIVALFWGLIDGEQFQLAYFAGMILILVGVYVTGRNG